MAQTSKKDDGSGCTGRSRGGLTTKIHALVDACGLPIALKLTEGHAHDSDALRQTLAERGAVANIKPMPNRKNIQPFSRLLYRQRNLVERLFSKIKQFRGVATRYDKRAEKQPRRRPTRLDQNLDAR
jgi:transposase